MLKFFLSVFFFLRGWCWRSVYIHIYTYFNIDLEVSISLFWSGHQTSSVSYRGVLWLVLVSTSPNRNQKEDLFSVWVWRTLAAVWLRESWCGNCCLFLWAVQPWQLLLGRLTRICGNEVTQVLVNGIVAHCTVPVLFGLMSTSTMSKWTRWVWPCLPSHIRKIII